MLLKKAVSKTVTLVASFLPVSSPRLARISLYLEFGAILLPQPPSSGIDYRPEPPHPALLFIYYEICDLFF